MNSAVFNHSNSKFTWKYNGTESKETCPDQCSGKDCSEGMSCDCFPNWPHVPSNIKMLKLVGRGRVNIICDAFDSLNHLKLLTLTTFAGMDTCEKYFQAQRFSLQGLILYSNAIAELPVNLFTNLQQLIYLELTDNGLKLLQDGIFAGLANLKVLVIIEDEVPNIADQSFSGLKSLTAITFAIFHKVPFDKNIPGMISMTSQTEEPDYVCVPPTLETLVTNAGDFFVNDLIDALRNSPENSLTKLQFKRPLKKPNVLKLQKNKIQRHKKQFYSEFNGLSNLEDLNISYSPLYSYSKDMFKGMKNLRVLGLSGTGGTGLCGGDLDDSLLRNDLAKLEELGVSECKINFIPNTFYFPKNLKRLYLSKNRLTFFEASTLRHLNMTYLDLSSNRLPGLSDEMWKELKRLKFDNPEFLVDLSYNDFQFICTYVQSLHFLVTNTQLIVYKYGIKFKKEDNTYLKYSEMVAQLPRLTQNCLIKENFSFVLTTFFTHLLCLLVLAVFFHYRWKLRYLYFIGQRRLHIGGRLVNYNPQVDVFITYDEGEPRIRQIVRNIILPFLREKNISYILGEVDFPGGDMVSHISGAITGTRKTLVLLSEDLFLDHYREYEMNLAIMREFNVRETEIKSLTLSGNNITLDPTFRYKKFPPKLEALVTEGSFFIDVFIEALRDSPENSLTKLDFKRAPNKLKVLLSHQNKTHSKIKRVNSESNGLSNLEVLDISYSFSKYDSEDMLEGMKNLRVLGLSGTKGTGLCGGDLDDSLLRTDLAKLEELWLRDCQITFIPRTFYFPKNLTLLFLGRNRLTYFEASLLRHLNMKYLDLSFNRLPGFSVEMWKELKRFKFDNPEFLVDLSHNDLQFICTYVQSLHFMVTNTQLYTSANEIMFRKEDNTYLNYTEMVAQLPRLTQNCLIKENFSFVLTIFFTHLLCLLVLTVFFHYRWKLRYLYFIGQRRLHIGGRLVNYNPRADVFITYDEGEPRIRQIVRNIILPFLKEKNISYILGEVDFPGGDMVSHISGAITGTRKTLVLLSEDLFLDHYREYEMNLAIMREFNVRGQVIVPVFVERVDMNTYPPEVETYLRNQLYRCLVYRNNQIFWKLLLHAIRNDK
ncbi:uncharacterized protein LOC131952229 [Physella acuta]|uniref:uncharacterized protein LOC131952229 n=1 Tax=Physella acuta TaxID=109671 RepID=UPI0027DDEBA2|nr:uncharacterized protein LOC131952229 [Physella acuta]